MHPLMMGCIKRGLFALVGLQLQYNAALMLIWLRTRPNRSTFSVNLLTAGLLPNTEQLWDPLIKT